MTRGIRVLAALLLGGVVGCSDPGAGTLPSLSASPSTTSPTPSASASATLTAEFHTAIAAYYAALTAAANDPEHKTDALAALIDPSCTCREVLTVLRAEAAKGHRLDYTYSAERIRVIELGELGGNATYTVVQTAGHQIDRDGRVLASYPGSTEKFSSHFSRRDGQWMLDRANRVD